MIGDRRAALFPVHAFESQGYNRIPAAFAELLAEKLGLDPLQQLLGEFKGDLHPPSFLQTRQFRAIAASAARRPPAHGKTR
ncbi:MAG: hypothetical protein O3A06_05290 [Proteobacteria bacterium]|nr:hypothetical protein [Pseudomonadota bacterium]